MHIPNSIISFAFYVAAFFMGRRIGIVTAYKEISDVLDEVDNNLTQIIERMNEHEPAGPGNGSDPTGDK